MSAWPSSFLASRAPEVRTFDVKLFEKRNNGLIPRVLVRTIDAFLPPVPAQGECLGGTQGRDGHFCRGSNRRALDYSSARVLIKAGSPPRMSMGMGRSPSGKACVMLGLSCTLLAGLPLLIAPNVAAHTDGERGARSLHHLAQKRREARLAAEEKPNAFCPGSPAALHAVCELHVEFDRSCAEVHKIMEARVAAVHDCKSNPGRYAGSATSGKRTTGDGRYTDKFRNSFHPTEKGGCRVHSCSESQVTSILDYSTNFCGRPFPVPGPSPTPARHSRWAFPAVCLQATFTTSTPMRAPR